MPQLGILARERSAARKANFLEAYRRLHSHRAACREIRVNVKLPYIWAQHDPRFEQDYIELKDEVNELLEATAIRVATEGQPKSVIGRDGTVATDMVVSERILEFMLRSRMPEKYGERKTLELTGPGGAAIEIQPEVHFHLVKLAVEELDRGGFLDAHQDRVEPLDSEGSDTAES